MPYTFKDGTTVYSYEDIAEKLGGNADVPYLWRKAGDANLLTPTKRVPPGNTNNRKWFTQEAVDAFVAWYYGRSKRGREIVEKGDMLTYEEVRNRLGVTEQAIYWYQKERGLLNPAGSWRAENGRWVSLVPLREVQAVERMRAGAN